MTQSLHQTLFSFFLFFSLSFSAYGQSAYSSNIEKITSLTEELKTIPEDDFDNRARHKLFLLYAVQEAGQKENAAKMAKDLEYLLREPTGEYTKPYILYQVLSAYAEDGDYERVLSILDGYREGSTDQNRTTRRYATVRALAEIYEHLGYFERSAALIEEVLITAEYRQNQNFKADLIANYLLLGNQYLEVGKPQEALDSAQRALSQIDIESNGSREMDPHVLSIIKMKAERVQIVSLIDLGRYQQAQARLDGFLEKAIKYDRTTEQLEAQVKQARLHLVQSQPEKAKTLLESVISNEAYDMESYGSIQTMKDYAGTLKEIGDFEQAFFYLRKAESIREGLSQKRIGLRSAFVTAEIENAANRDELRELEKGQAVAAAAARRSELIAVLSVVIAMFAVLIGFILIQLLKTQRAGSKAYKELSEIDPLTNVYNRRGFLREFEGRLNECRKNGNYAFLGLLDLNDFKLVNDIHGHNTGDEILRSFAEIIKKISSQDLLIGRLGGDEFGIIGGSDKAGQTAMEVGNQLSNLLTTPIDTGEASLRISSSMGFVVFPDVDESIDQLLEQADFALYQAKRSDDALPKLFSEKFKEKTKRQFMIKHLLSDICESEFGLVYQPIYQVDSGNIFYLEALARWSNIGLGSISPSEFIPLAEQNGAITDLTLMLFKSMLRDMAVMPSNISMSFNLSAVDLMSKQSILSLVAAINRSKISPHRIVFELTETAIMKNYKVVVENVEFLSRFGVKIALDDFGTGFSSLSYLRDLPIDFLKFDRSFAADIVSNSKSQNILRSIFTLCDNLGIQCVAEGIETEEQLRMINSLGVSRAQGFFLGVPESLEDLMIGGYLDGNINAKRA